MRYYRTEEMIMVDWTAVEFTLYFDTKVVPGDTTIPLVLSPKEYAAKPNKILRYAISCECHYEYWSIVCVPNSTLS